MSILVKAAFGLSIVAGAAALPQAGGGAGPRMPAAAAGFALPAPTAQGFATPALAALGRPAAQAAEGGGSCFLARKKTFRKKSGPPRLTKICE